jgi:Na+/H+ antiporter NhaD/arsenite permease-like protein
MGIPIFPLWWAILFGGTLLGNLTIIGSTANIVAVGVMEKRKAGQVGFLEWLKAGIVVAIPTLLIAHLLLAAQLKWMI